METFIGIIVIIGVLIFVMRLLGAWMLRINEVIKLLKEIKSQLIKLNDYNYK